MSDRQHRPDAGALLAAVQRMLPEALDVRDIVPMVGGASREIWAFTATTAAGPKELVLRRDPPGPAPEGPAWASIQLDRTTEHHVLAAAWREGVPVPRSLGALSPEDGLGPGLVMERVGGTAAIRQLIAEPGLAAGRGHARAAGRVLAQIHEVGTAAVPALAPRSDDPPHRLWQQCADWSGLSSPVLEMAFRWLDETAVAPGPPVLVHGDFRLGNITFDERGLVAVLDWEAAHLGQPGEDVGWFWAPAHVGSAGVRGGALGTVDDFVEAYASHGGREMTGAELLHWRMFAAVRWAVLCHLMGQLHTSGTRRSLELAAVGRRFSEQEWTVLELLDRA